MISIHLGFWRGTLFLLIFAVGMLFAVLTVTRWQTPHAPYIAYVSAQAGNTDVYRIRVDGTQARNVSQDAGYDCCPTWSPDGKWLAYASDRAGSSDIYRQLVNGRAVERLTFTHNEDESSPAWSPDGQSLLYVQMIYGRQDIYRLTIGGDTLRLTDSISSDALPAWHPDGQSITFLSFNNGERDVFVMAPDGSDVRAITNTTEFESSPLFVPDTPDALSYIAVRGQKRQLVRRDADTETALLSDITGDYHTWSPDGAQVAFVVDGKIVIANRDGSARRVLVESATYPRWSPVIDMPWRGGWVALLMGAVGVIVAGYLRPAIIR